MEKRALLAIGLSCLVLVIWGILFPQRPAPPPLPQGAPAGANAASGPVAGDRSTGVAKPDAAAADKAATAGREGEPGPGSRQGDSAAGKHAVSPKREAPEGAPAVVIQTDVARIEISNPGGKLTSWSL